ncbi:hypothetical protein VTJ04DRAFT_8193 [Mycothermus thermophilus]|uniref:uncharacterized protein n=1 Tax=Humicola insolens TaxID=85995 RepID=UPI003742EEB9
MTVAPAADFYVARVACNEDDIPDSAGNMAKAIRWAADNEVDIISMSFGFDDEPLVQGEYAISNAICGALKDRNQRLLFFAAASNDGGNRQEMFPARHRQVISVRATDDKGWMEHFNPPPGYSSKHPIMTLGRDVPGAALGGSAEAKNGVVYRTGTSVSTPIAAGIAAMILGFVRLHEDKLIKVLGGSVAKVDRFFTLEGMRQVLWKMSTEMMDRWHYLSGPDWPCEEIVYDARPQRSGSVDMTIDGMQDGRRLRAGYVA